LSKRPGKRRARDGKACYHGQCRWQKEQAVLVDLIQVPTRDGVRLDGAFRAPAEAAPAKVGVDAFCLVHGTGGNFYGSTLFDGLAERLLGLGCAVLRVNTRGHDGISSAVTAAGGKRLGAGYEVVDDCRHDLSAWVTWLKQRAGPRVGLVGHSLGAVKCLYAAAREPGLAPRCLIALSPPRLSHAWFCASPEGPQFLETYHRAERLVQDGQPLALLDVTLPFPFVITAGGYVEKYGPEERYNYLPLLTGLPAPTLVTLGGVEVENSMAFRGAAEALAKLAGRAGPLTVATIAGADHFYSDVRPSLFSTIDRWLCSAVG
jgi:alpha/beta superfamily hydrolase